MENTIALQKSPARDFVILNRALLHRSGALCGLHGILRHTVGFCVGNHDHGEGNVFLDHAAGFMHIPLTKYETAFDTALKEGITSVSHEYIDVSDMLPEK